MRLLLILLHPLPHLLLLLLRFTISENVTSQVRRKQGKLKKSGRIEEELVEELVEEEMSLVGPPPTAFDTLPFQLARGARWVVVTTPTIPSLVMEAWREKSRAEEQRKKVEEEWEQEKKEREEEKAKKKEAKARRSKVSRYREVEEGEEVVRREEVEEVATRLPRNANQMWTDEDLVELAKLIKRIPGGSLERWVVLD